MKIPHEVMNINHFLFMNASATMTLCEFEIFMTRRRWSFSKWENLKRRRGCYYLFCFNFGSTDLYMKGKTMEQKSNLTKAQKYLFGVGDFCGDMSMSFKTYYWQIFLTSVVMMPLDKLQWMNGIQSTIGLVMMFFYGVVLDAFPTLRWGHYRSIYLVITPIYAVLVSIAWWFGAKITDYNVLIVALLISQTIFTFFFQLVYSGNITMIQVIAKGNETDANTLASHRWAAIKAAVIVLGLIGAPALDALGGQDKTSPYAIFATIIAVLSLFGYAVHFVITKGVEEEGTGAKKTPEEKAAAKAKRVTFKQMIMALVTNKYLVILLLANVFTTATSFWFATYGVYYYKYVAIGNDSLYSMYITSTNIFAMVGSLLSDVLAKKMPLKKVSCITILLCIVAFAGCKVAGTNAILFTGCICAYQFFAAINYPCFIAQYGNCVTYYEWKSGSAPRATIMSVSSWTPTIAGVINGQLGPIILRKIGFEAALGTNQPATVTPGVVNMLSLLPILYYVLAFVIFTFAYTLTADKLKKMQEEINARNSIAA